MPDLSPDLGVRVAVVVAAFIGGSFLALVAFWIAVVAQRGIGPGLSPTVAALMVLTVVGLAFGLVGVGRAVPPHRVWKYGLVTTAPMGLYLTGVRFMEECFWYCESEAGVLARAALHGIGVWVYGAAWAAGVVWAHQRLRPSRIGSDPGV